MKTLRKILISSLVLLIIGTIGLFTTIFIGGSGNVTPNFGTGQGYTFCIEDISHMFRGFLLDEESTDLSFDEIEIQTNEYLLRNNLNDLGIVEIMEFSRNFYIEIYEIDTGVGAMELLVDKSSGAIFPEYGPNMMWNLKYGMHSRIPISQSELDMSISEDKAIELAEKYLVKVNIDEFTGDEVEKFYGYYTIHTLDANGGIAGMLSVNGFSGDVWYHNWHGIFIDMVEEN